MEESDSLWLEHDTTYEELVEALQQIDAATMEHYQEVVFCGFGEPTEALDVLLHEAYIKEHYHKPVRVDDLNGLGSLINGEDIAPKLAGLVDTVSISLNTPDAGGIS